eukprot:g902.t1
MPTTKGDEKEKDDESTLKTALMQTQLRMIEMGRKHRMEFRDLQRRNHELTESLLSRDYQVRILETNTDYVTCSEREITDTLRKQFNRLVENNKSYVSRHEMMKKQIAELEKENERLSTLLRQVTSKSAEAVHQYRGLHDMLVEKVKNEKDLKSKLAKLQKCRDDYDNVVEQEHKISSENEKLSSSLRTAELEILSSRASEAIQGTKMRELLRKLKEEQRRSASMKKEMNLLRLSSPEDMQRLLDERDRLEKEIDDSREVLGVLKSGSLHSAIKRINRVSMLKQNRMKKTIESLESENKRLVKIEFHVKTLERERQVLVEYVKRLESKLGDEIDKN